MRKTNGCIFAILVIYSVDKLFIKLLLINEKKIYKVKENCFLLILFIVLMYLKHVQFE